MFKTLFLFISVTIVFSAKGQWNDYDNMRYRIGGVSYWRAANFMREEKDTTMAANAVLYRGVCSYDYNLVKNKKKRQSCKVETYDSLGFLRKESYLGKKSDTVFFIENTVNKFGKITSKVYRNQKRELYRINYTYLDSDQVESYYFYKNSRLETKRFYTYISGKVSAIYTYHKDTTKYEFLNKYYYVNDTGELLLTEILDSKGKKIKVWDYSCSPTTPMKRVEAKKETRICQSKIQLENGHRQEVWVMQQRNSLFKYVYEYDSLDRMVSYIYYGGKHGDELLGQRIYVYTDQGTEQTWTYGFHTSGVPAGQIFSRADGQGRMLYSQSTRYNARGKKLNCTETQYTYNADLLSGSKGANTKRRRHAGWEWVTEYSYQFVPKP